MYRGITSMIRSRRIALLWVCMTGLLLFGAVSASLAGDGAIDGKRLNLKVMFLYDEKDVEQWKPVFTEASKLLWNATDGRLQLGDICFFSGCQAAKDRADIWISDNQAGASANGNGLGKSGWHVFLSKLHKSTSGSAHGQFGIAHELGHYVFDLKDEYGGAIWTADRATKFANPPGSYMWKNGDLGLDSTNSVFYCTSRSGGTGCIMDGGTTITSAFSRTEFCAADHVAGSQQTVRMTGEASASPRFVQNNQEQAHGKSCWSLVASKLGGAVPTAPSTAMPAGHQDVVFNNCGGPERYVLVIDRSGSMCGDRIALARAAAGNFVDLADVRKQEQNKTVPGDEVGVISFDCTIITHFPLREFDSEATRDSARQAINGIFCDGTTSIGGGLRAGIGMLQAAGEPGCSETMILLSDGQQNCGEEPLDVLPDIRQRKTIVHTIGLGSGADVSVLQSIASGTGGRFFFAAQPGDLPGIFNQIKALSSGAGIVDSVKKHLEANGEDVLNIPIEAGASEAIISVYGQGLNLSLISPDGTAVPPLPANIEFFEGTDFRYYRLLDPEPGTWKAVIKATQATEYTFTAMAQTTDVEVVLDSLPAEVGYPTPIPLRVIVTAGGPVTGAVVTARVQRPQGDPVPLTLYDDGLASHGDTEAGDAVYSALYTGHSVEGVYSFEITARNVDGVIIPDDGGVFPPIPAKAFQRVINASVNVTSAPGIAIQWGALALPQSMKSGYSTMDIVLSGKVVHSKSSSSVTLLTKVPITNTGAMAIAAGDLSVQYRWLNASGSVVDQGVAATSVQAIAPSETVSVPVRFPAPPGAGNFTLELTGASASTTVIQEPRTSSITILPAIARTAGRNFATALPPTATPNPFVVGSGKMVFTSRLKGTNVDILLGEWSGEGMSALNRRSPLMQSYVAQFRTLGGQYLRTAFQVRTR